MKMILYAFSQIKHSIFLFNCMLTEITPNYLSNLTFGQKLDLLFLEISYLDKN